MRNCEKCNKELSRSTKGNRCLQCYRNRNAIMDYNNDDDAININIIHNSSTNDSIIPDKNDSIIPLYDDNDLDERAVINLIKQNMLMVKNRDSDIIEILKSQVEFLKDEIKHKNELINNLMLELAENKNHDYLLKSRSKHVILMIAIRPHQRVI